MKGETKIETGDGET